MDAVIYRVETRKGAADLSVAGTPVLLRQLQWLRAAGCDRIVVEVGSENTAAVERLLDDPLCAGVTLLPTGDPVGPRELAKRANFALDRAFVALSCDLVGEGDLWELFARDEGQGVVGLTREPQGFASNPAACVLLTKPDGATARAAVVPLSSWGVRVTSPSVAHRLSIELLERRLSGLPVHGAEVSPGVFRARGVRVSPGATVRAPVFLGPGAVIAAGATVGPFAVLGARAVVEPGANIEYSTVADDTVVGEGLTLQGCLAAPEGVRDFERDREVISLGDPLLLSARSERAASGLAGRALALVLLALLLPFVAVETAITRLRRTMRGASPKQTPSQQRGLTHTARALSEVLRGSRAWVGVAEGSLDASAGRELLAAASRAPRGVLPIDDVLVPEGADAPTRLRARAWYSHEKRPSLDAVLLWRLLRGARPAF